MTNDTLPEHLEAIGRQLTAAARDLASPPRRSRRRSVRLVAVSTTGAAIVTATVLAVGATTGTPPAFAVTRHHDGSVLVQINQLQSLPDANHKLTAMGIEEQISIQMATGPASVSGPVNCVPSPSGTKVPGPPVKALVGTNGTEVIDSGNTGAGTWHMAACHLYGDTGSGNTGNTGSGNTGAG